MRMPLLWALSLVLAKCLVCGQTSQPNSQEGQPSPAPASSVVSPAPADQVQKLQDLLAKPITPRGPDDPVPAPYMVYQLFFMHLANLDALAERLDAKGEDGNAWRTHEQKRARLTPEEGEIMKRVAYDCNQALQEQDKRIHDAIFSFRHQYPNGQLRNVQAPQEVQELWMGRIQIINSHIDQLRALLGDSSFQKLDDWVLRDFPREKKRAPVPRQTSPLPEPTSNPVH